MTATQEQESRPTWWMVCEGDRIQAVFRLLEWAQEWAQQQYPQFAKNFAPGPNGLGFHPYRGQRPLSDRAQTLLDWLADYPDEGYGSATAQLAIWNAAYPQWAFVDANRFATQRVRVQRALRRRTEPGIYFTRNLFRMRLTVS